MRSIHILMCSFLLLFGSAGNWVSSAHAQERASKRKPINKPIRKPVKKPVVRAIAPLDNALRPLSWSQITKDEYSFPGCTTAKIELKTQGGVAPITIEYDSLVYANIPITKQGSKTYLMVPAKLPNTTTNINLKATDARGAVIRKRILLDVKGPFIKPIRILSVKHDSLFSKDSSGWGIKMQADYEKIPGSNDYGFKCTSGRYLKYENLEYIAEYQNGFKYKARRNFVADINKGRRITYYIQHDGGQSNKVTINLPKHIAEYSEQFKHEEAAVAVLGRRPTFTGTDIIRLPNYNGGDLIRGNTSCGSDFLTYENASAPRMTFLFPGAPMGSYTAKLVQSPQKGEIINLNSNRIKFDWRHLGWGLKYDAVIEAQRRQGICSDKIR